MSARSKFALWWLVAIASVGVVGWPEANAKNISCIAQWPEPTCAESSLVKGPHEILVDQVSVDPQVQLTCDDVVYRFCRIWRQSIVLSRFFTFIASFDNLSWRIIVFDEVTWYFWKVYRSYKIDGFLDEESGSTTKVFKSYLYRGKLQSAGQIGYPTLSQDHPCDANMRNVSADSGLRLQQSGSSASRSSISGSFQVFRVAFRSPLQLTGGPPQGRGKTNERQGFDHEPKIMVAFDGVRDGADDHHKTLAGFLFVVAAIGVVGFVVRVEWRIRQPKRRNRDR